MPKLSEIQDQDPTINMFYGPVGSGKTSFSFTAPDSVWLIPPNRLSTIKGFMRMGLGDPLIELMERDKDPSEAKCFDKYTDTMDYYLDGPGKGKIKAIIIDEVDHLRKGAMVKGVHISDVDGKSKTLEKAKKKGGVSEGYVMAAIQDFGAEMSLIEQFIFYYTEKCAREGIHLIIHAHERFTFTKGPNKEDVLSRISPGFTGKTFPDDVISPFDNVWRFSRTKSLAGKGRTEIDTVGNSQIRAKCCFPGKFLATEIAQELGQPKDTKAITFLDVISRTRGVTKDTLATFVP